MGDITRVEVGGRYEDVGQRGRQRAGGVGGELGIVGGAVGGLAGTDLVHDCAVDERRVLLDEVRGEVPGRLADLGVVRGAALAEERPQVEDLAVGLLEVVADGALVLAYRDRDGGVALAEGEVVEGFRVQGQGPGSVPGAGDGAAVRGAQVEQPSTPKLTTSRDSGGVQVWDLDPSRGRHW